MYITLSIEATVYADSDDKYSSIFKNFKDEKSLDYYQNLNIELSIYRCLEFGTRGRSSTYKWRQSVLVLSLTQSAERSKCFQRWIVCIESKGGEKNAPPVHIGLNQGLREESGWMLDHY